MTPEPSPKHADQIIPANPRLMDLIHNAEEHLPCVADGKAQVTYGQLRDRVETAAKDFRRCDPQVGDSVFVDSAASIEFIIALLAASEVGWVPIPLDPSTPQQVLEHVTERCRVRYRISIGLKAENQFEISSLGRSANEHSFFRPDGLVMGMLTSGTSGWPKAVCLTSDNLRNSFGSVSEYLGYRNHASAAVVLPLHYSYALLSQVLCMFHIGGRVRLFSPAEVRNPIKLSRLIEEANLETFCGVPSSYQALRMVHQMSPFEMSSVKLICSAGAAMDRSLYADMKTMFPSATVVNNYGMTEAAPRISYIRDNDPKFFEPTCGRPMPGVEVCVVDPDTHQQVTDGVAGVLAVRGPNVTPGYMDDFQATANAFTADGWLLSGDGARIVDGLIYLAGRLDDLFNVGGEKVSPIEVERALTTHPMIDRAAVRGIMDPQRGMVPVAFVELGVGGEIRRRDLLNLIRPLLTPVKLPHQVYEVRSFPTTQNGKLKRNELSIDDQEHIVREIL